MKVNLYQGFKPLLKARNIFLVIASLLAAATMQAQDDVTATYLTNANFDTDPSFDINSTEAIVTDGDGRVREITGWTSSYVDGSNIVGATFEYGSAATLNGYTPPAQDSTGATTGASLGLQASWGNYILYSQEVTLPAGAYTIIYSGYNAHESNASTQSLVGWVPASGTSTLSTNTSFPVGVWTPDQVTFSLTSETTGTIQVGVKDIAGGSGSNPRLFIDGVQLMFETIATPVLEINETSFMFSYNTLVQTFTVGGLNLSSDITLTAPTGVTLDKTTITAAELNTGSVTVTATATVQSGIDGNIVISSSELDDQTIACTSGIADVYYNVTHLASGYTLGTNGDGYPAVVESATDATQYLHFDTIQGETEVYNIVNGEGEYLHGSGWTTTWANALNGTSTQWALSGDYFSSTRISVLSSAYIATDGNDAGQRVWCDKAVDHANGLYMLNEAQVVIINYLDDAGNTVKAPRLAMEGLTTGETYTATEEDKATFISDGSLYEFDATSTDNVIITDGNTSIDLMFIKSAISADTTLASLSFTGSGKLYPDFDPSVDTYKLVIYGGNESYDLEATTGFEGAGLAMTDLEIMEGTDTVTITVTAENGSTGTYTVMAVIEDCFTPLYTDRDNLVPDPTFSAASISDGYEGWGNKSITTVDTLVYCGTGSAMFSATTNSWPDGAAMDFYPTWKGNTTYRVRVMYKTTDGSMGMITNSGVADFGVNLPNTSGEWALLDTTFTTVASPAASFITINNLDMSADGLTAYFDNYELYELDGNAMLDTLYASAGTLSPEFSSDVYDYELVVPGETEVTFSAFAQSELATIEGEMTYDLTTDTLASFTVIAENGDSLFYNVKLTYVSTDISLATLVASAGTLTMVSDTAYSLVFTTELETITLTATASNDSAKVIGIGEITISAEGGVIEITVTAEDGVTTQVYTITYSFDLPNALAKNIENLVSVYPTITSGEFNIQFNGALGTLSIYDLSGKKVLSKVASQTIETVSVPKSGIYFIKVNSEGQSAITKVIKLDQFKHSLSKGWPMGQPFFISISCMTYFMRFSGNSKTLQELLIN